MRKPCFYFYTPTKKPIGKPEENQYHNEAYWLATIQSLAGERSMDSDYIWTKEISEAKKNNTDIIPLFIRSCDFEEKQFGIDDGPNVQTKQGLPRDDAGRMRWIVSSEFPNRDEGYLKIVEGVKAKLKAP